MAVTLVALPVLVLDNLPDGQSAGAVETVDTAKDATTTSTEIEQELAAASELALLAAPATTEPAPPTTAPTTSTTAPTTTAPPTTAPPTTAPPTTAPPTTAPPTTAPPTTAPPTTVLPPPASSTTVASIIRSVFGADGDAAVAVARCESGLNPNARSANGRYHGLFQIGSGHAAAFQRVTGLAFETGWYDPTANTTYAHHLFRSSGWSSWPHCGAGH